MGETDVLEFDAGLTEDQPGQFGTTLTRIVKVMQLVDGHLVDYKSMAKLNNATVNVVKLCRAVRCRWLLMPNCAAIGFRLNDKGTSAGSIEERGEQ
jgi:hypothetical protein